MLKLLDELAIAFASTSSRSDTMMRGSRGAREVVEERRAAVVLKHVAQRHDRHLIDRRDRPLRRRIVGAQRFDRVADELEPDRMRLAGGKDVDDAAADRELAVLVGRILAREAGVDQQLGQIGRRDVLAGPQVDRRRQQPLRRA